MGVNPEKESMMEKDSMIDSKSMEEPEPYTYYKYTYMKLNIKQTRPNRIYNKDSNSSFEDIIEPDTKEARIEERYSCKIEFLGVFLSSSRPAIGERNISWESGTR